MIDKNVSCKDCDREVKDIPEYQSMATSENMDVNEWVAANDSLYDRRSNKVVCTSCYVKGIMQGIYR